MSSDVAIITTGGTISSKTQNKEIYVDNNIIQTILEKYSNNVKSIDIYPLMDKLSENMTPDDWFKIADKVQEIINTNYNKIIITHGTDTMIYTATAIELFFGHLDNITIICTGSMNNIDSPNSDVKISIESSLKAILQLNEGVFVNIRSPQSNEKMFLNQATNVKPIHHNSEGIKQINEKIGIYKNNKWDIQNTYSQLYSLPYKNNLQTHRKIKYLNVYPDLKIDNPDKYELIILNSYHSLTVPTINKKDTILNVLKNTKTNIILTGYSNTTELYSTTLHLIKNGLHVIKSMQPHVAYVYFYIGLAQNKNIDNLIKNT